MKKLVYLVVAALSVNMAVAQTPTKQETPAKKVTTEDRAKRSTAVMVNELTLNADQEAKVYALKVEKLNKAKDIRTKYKDDQATRKTEIKAIHTEYTDGIKAILTADQYTKWEASVAKRKVAMKARAERRKEASKNTPEEDELQNTILD